MIKTHMLQIGSSRKIRILKNRLLIKTLNNSKISSWDTPKLRQKASKEKSLCDEFSAIETNSWKW